MRRAWVLWLLFLPLPGCASAPVRPPAFPTETLLRADRLLSDGCYTCLIEARDLFRQLALGPYRAHALPSLFESQLLLVLRRKELAIDHLEELAAARRTAAELQAEASAARYLSLVERVAEDSVGATERQLRAFQDEHARFGDEVPSETAWVEAGPLGTRLGTYVALALRCTWQPPERRSAKDTPSVPADEAPMITYRRAICFDRPNVAELEVVRALVPEFHEAHHFLARGWLSDIGRYGFTPIVNAMLDVVPRFPESSAATFTAGTIEQSRRSCEEALALYDRTLVLRPNHENALLGRTECLSRMKRHEEAIDEATKLAAQGGRNLSTAYYWRAWNQHTKERLPEARQDIEAAKKALPQPDVNTALLAGVIEHDQDDLDPATRDLRLARGLSANRACLALSYLALVSVKRSNWSEAASGFQDTMECYAASLREARAQLAAVTANTELAADFRVMRLAEIAAKIDEDEKLRHVAAMNAAKGFANVGNYSAAVRLGTIALEDPALADEVHVLRTFLVDSGAPVRLPDTVPVAVR